MKLEDIYAEWDQDCVINEMALDTEAIKIAKLHSKYQRLFSQERLVWLKFKSDLAELALLKYEYYDGTMDEDTLKEKGWKPFPKRVLKPQLEMHINADPDIIKLTLKIGLQKEKVDFLESVIKSLHNRNFNLRTAVDFLKFKNGGY